MSYLFHVPLRGIGTTEVEAIGSYIQRLATIHGISAGKLLKYCFNKYYGKQKKITSFQSKGSLAVYVRPNNSTYEVIKVLSAATGQPEIRSGTFLALQETLHRTTGAFSHHFRWCPTCMSEFSETNDSGYFKLSWHINDITHCQLHGDPLIEQCENCGSTQSGYGYTYKPRTSCRKCGNPLSTYKSSPLRGEKTKAQDSGLIDLVEEISTKHDLTYPFDSVKKVVTQLFDHAWEMEKELELWKLIPRDECLHITSGHQVITLTIARRVSYRLGIPLTQLLMGDINQSSYLLSPEWSNTLPTQITPKKRKNKVSRDMKLKQVLQITENNPSSEPLPLREVARRIGTSVGYLHFNFPEISQNVLRNYSLWKKEKKQSAIKQCRAEALSFFSNGPKSKKSALRTIRKKTGLPKELLRREINMVYDMLWSNNVQN